MLKKLKNPQTLITYNLFFFITAWVFGNFFINLSIVFFSILLFFFHHKKLLDQKYYSKEIKLLSFFFIIIISSSIIKNNQFSDLSLIRFYFLCLSFYFFSNEIIIAFKKYSNVYFIIIFFVSLDAGIQYFFGKNLIGMLPYQGNFTGFFGDEQIIGGYLTKFLILTYTFVFFQNKKHNNFIIYLFLLACIIFIIILSAERRSFIDLCLFFLIFTLINYKRIKIIYFLSFFIILFVLKSHIIEKVIKPINYQLGLLNNNSITVEQMDKYGVQFKPSLKNNIYYAQYSTALNIWLDNFLLGAGNKKFREECKKNKYENLENDYFQLRCTTHPHNIYLQVLSEFGLINFILFIFLCYYSIIKNINYKINSKTIFPFWVFVLIILSPLPSGSILGTSFGTYFWSILGILLHEKNTLVK